MKTCSLMQCKSCFWTRAAFVHVWTPFKYTMAQFVFLISSGHTGHLQTNGTAFFGHCRHIGLHIFWISIPPSSRPYQCLASRPWDFPNRSWTGQLQIRTQALLCTPWPQAVRFLVRKEASKLPVVPNGTWGTSGSWESLPSTRLKLQLLEQPCMQHVEKLRRG